MQFSKDGHVYSSDWYVQAYVRTERQDSATLPRT